MTVVIATRLRNDRLDYLTAMHASLTRQSVPWEAVIALDGTTLAPGILLPVPVYRYRKHPGQMTAQVGYDQLEAAAREHAWAYGRSLRAVLRGGKDLVRG